MVSPNNLLHNEDLLDAELVYTHKNCGVLLTDGCWLVGTRERDGITHVTCAAAAADEEEEEEPKGGGGGGLARAAAAAAAWWPAAFCIGLAETI